MSPRNIAAAEGPIWHHRTAAGRLALYAGWLGLVALFVWDAPRAAADLGSRAWPPRWSYMERLWGPLWDTLNIATLGTLLCIVLAVPLAFLAASNTTP